MACLLVGRCAPGERATRRRLANGLFSHTRQLAAGAGHSDEGGAPRYLARHGTPERPEDLLRHECITFRSQTTGALYAYPSRSRISAPLRWFVDAAKEPSVRSRKPARGA